MDFTKQQILGFNGGVFLLLGVFLPVVSMPIVGTISIFSTGRIEGYALLALAVINLILVFKNKIQFLKVTSILSFLIVLIGFLYLVLRLYQVKADISSELKDNPFGGLAEAMASTIQIQYGWLALFIGCLMLAYIAFFDKTKKALVDEQDEVIVNIEPPVPVKKRVSTSKLVSDDIFSHNAMSGAEDSLIQNLKACPLCAEDIKFAAIKCKYCGGMIE